ncbi:MAG: hypothetical protein EOO40_08900 [Deltaproteobacteria bacterium]|nr:MAG: hypothetical protein EOO40_08900 [Deltaproteobacteria bacterium]
MILAVAGAYGTLATADGIYVDMDYFYFDDFCWRNPNRCSPAEARDYYVAQVRRPSSFGGVLEADAIGKLWGVRVRIWRPVPECGRNHYQSMMSLGEEAETARQTLHLVLLRQRHFRALLGEPNGAFGSAFTQLEAGAGGDCLYLALTACANAAGMRREGITSVPQLREATAGHIAARADSAQSIYSLCCDVFADYCRNQKVADKQSPV